MSREITISYADQQQYTLRAQLDDVSVINALKKHFGLNIPEARKSSDVSGARALWFSPDELLILTDRPCDMNAVKSGLPLRHLFQDMSGARVLFTIKGDHVRDVFAKGTPRDMSGLKLGEVVRSHLGQVAVAFWLIDEAHAEMVCFRSVAGYVQDWLEFAAGKETLPAFHQAM